MSVEGTQILKLMSFNIQAGTSTARYRQYVTRSWRQVLPNHQRIENLDAIAELAAGFDLVGLQEVDCGSLRSGFVNQIKYLATHAGFPWWTHQPNRRIGKIAHAANGVLSRVVPDRVSEHKLPGAIPGRGALFLHFGHGDEALCIVVLHLALGRRARQQQLQYVAKLLSGHRHLIVMGDLNAGPDAPEVDDFRRATGLISRQPPATYPSWQPRRRIDQMLFSPHIEVLEHHAIDSLLSDHLPITATVRLPFALQNA
ncbi:MAG: endonuclease/exonuclease/phosphatase family protein [Wenzhouxiangellaceae bacterium]